MLPSNTEFIFQPWTYGGHLQGRAEPFPNPIASRLLWRIRVSDRISQVSTPLYPSRAEPNEVEVPRAKNDRRERRRCVGKAPPWSTIFLGLEA
jgi:hypothetical protein